ncbi:MAG: hypothetical protein JSR15_00605 [Proteobacteria bacterium]|nr:hypothetical protein [Pseudomonadota bacterium]
MASESSWVLERFGTRWARLALVVIGVVFIALICSWAAIGVASAWRAGHEFKALADGAIALLLVLLSMRVMALNWRATRVPPQQPAVLPDGNEQTGVWGVGGPSMREPGQTGVFPPRRPDRR